MPAVKKLLVTNVVPRNRGVRCAVNKHRAQVILLTLILVLVVSKVPARGQPFNSSEGGTIATALASAPLPYSTRMEIEQMLRARRYTPVEELLLQAINKNPKSSRLLTLIGDVFFLDGKYLNCAVAMKKAEALAPIDDRSRFTLAMAYIAMKHPDWARPELEKLARADPCDARYPYWISRVDYHDMHLSEAVANARKAIRLDPRFMKAYNNLGLYEEGLGKYKEAIMAYRKAIRLNDEEGLRSPWPTLNLGVLLSKMDHLDEAEIYLRQSLSEAPHFPKAHFRLGALLEKENRDTAALKELEEAVTYDPSYAEPYFVVGKILERQHQPEKAREAFRMFKQLKRQEQADDLSK